MVLIPMKNAWIGHIVDQLLKTDPEPLGPESNTLGCLADAVHGNTLAGEERFLPQALQTKRMSVVLGYHPQTGGTAVHRVELSIIRKIYNHRIIFLYFINVCKMQTFGRTL
jgi:hypothetical protein